MKDGETRTLRVDIPSDLANLLDQVKIISGKSKRDAVIQALQDFFESLCDSREEDVDQK